MNDREFNLLDERWIRVIRPDCSEEEVSLIDALVNAHEYQDLSGEILVQDVAVLRMMLAVMHRVLSSVDENGDDAPLETVDDALFRWDTIWHMGHLPEQAIREYLDKWHERFWLFHPERPFYQVNEAAIGTENQAFKLNGELSQSNNKARLFTMCAGKDKECMSYSEAARWLIYLNGFDDTSAKPKGKNLPTPGIGWLGKLGLITAVGNNLFETLMLNMVLLPDGFHLWKTPEMPCWELDTPRVGERVQIGMPNNAAGLLTLQSRRILLKRDEGKVVGYTLLGGDFFPKEDALLEQMTVWTNIKDKKGTHQHYQPRRHDMTRQMWRDFGSILSYEEDTPRPGVVKWVTLLKKAKILPQNDRICFRIASVQYGDKDFFVTNVFGDQLTFSTELLTEAGATAYDYVINEVKLCEKAAYIIGKLYNNLCSAAGHRSKEKKTRKDNSYYVKEQFFDSIDAPFRRWLSELAPNADRNDLLDYCEKWHSEVKQIAKAQGKLMAELAGEKAFAGCTVEVEENDIKVKYHFSAPEAYNWFLGGLNNIYPEKTAGMQEVNTNG